MHACVHSEFCWQKVLPFSRYPQAKTTLQVSNYWDKVCICTHVRVFRICKDVHGSTVIQKLQRRWLQEWLEVLKCLEELVRKLLSVLPDQALLHTTACLMSLPPKNLQE